MKPTQFSLAGVMLAVASCAVGFVVIHFVNRSAPGPLWAWLVGVYWFGAVAAVFLRGGARPVRVIRLGLVGLLVGIVPGCLFAVAEDPSAAKPSNAVELGSIICSGFFGAVAGIAFGFFVTPTAGPRV